MSNPNISKHKSSWFKKRRSNQTIYESVSDIDVKPVAGYYGFKLYFPIKGEISEEATLNRVRAFEQYIQRNITAYPLDKVEKNKSFFVDYNLLIEDKFFNTEWSEFKEELVLKTDYCLDCMSLAMHQCLMEKFEECCKEAEQIVRYSFYICTIRARIYNFGPVLPLKDLKTNYLGKLVCVHGTIMKAGNRQLLCQYMAFQCRTCNGKQNVRQTGGLFKPPSKCETKTCRAQSYFEPLLSSPYTRAVDWQSLKIQELSNDTQSEGGRVPRTYDCEVTGNLVNCCVPGDDVEIMGVLRRRCPENSTDRKQASLFQFYLDIVSVINSKNQSEAGQITFNTMDYYAIRKIHEEPALFRFLVHSLCPAIYGHEMVKAGLLLALLTSSPARQPSAGDLRRPHSHVLVVGDPGLGKSRMLQACARVAPRGVYVCGRASTTSGMTATVTRDAGGEYTLEGGALVLADRGCCCIDEFDKMSEQHQCLLEAMEQQSVSIAKAGIICTLPTRATVLAAANPVEGHYNKSKSIAENLKIKPAMLSRFDLVFILLDKPDSEMDKLLPRHVLEMHMGDKYKKKSLKKITSVNSVEHTTLRNSLKLEQDEHIEHLPHILFRKYIAYAQKYVKPKLSQEAKDVLKEFYLHLRRQFQDGKSTPVTVRQLHSLIRLTQARAKAELREEATSKDAMDVVEIMKYCLIDVFADISAEDTTIKSNLKSTSRNQIKCFLDIVETEAQSRNSMMFSINELRSFCSGAGIANSNITSTLDMLNLQGILLSKGQGNFQFVRSNLI